MTQITAKFRFERDTKGALFYREIDSQGRPFPSPNSAGCVIGALYIRKTAINGSSQPKSITVTIDTE